MVLYIVLPVVNVGVAFVPVVLYGTYDVSMYAMLYVGGVSWLLISRDYDDEKVDLFFTNVK